jgi:hypothetical protein
MIAFLDLLPLTYANHAIPSYIRVIYPGPMVGFPYLAGVRGCCLFHSVQTGFEANATSFEMGTGDSFIGVKRPGREAEH